MKSIKNKVRNLACGGIFILMQAGTALATEGNKKSSGFTISGTFSSLLTGTSDILKEGMQYFFDNVSSAAWGALALGILILTAKAGLSHFSADGNPADAAKHENAIVGVVRVAAVAVLAIGVIYMLYQKFA